MPFTKQFTVHLGAYFSAKTTIPVAADYFMALHIGDCAETGDQGEVVDAAYTRMQLAMQTVSGADGEDLDNTAVIVFPAALVDNGQVTHFSLWTDVAVGEPHFYGELDAPIAYDIGISPALAIGALKLTMADRPCP